MYITNTSDLLLRNCYQNGTLFFESDKPQTVELFLPLSGLYELTLVGGGVELMVVAIIKGLTTLITIHVLKLVVGVGQVLHLKGRFFCNVATI